MEDVSINAQLPHMDEGAAVIVDLFWILMAKAAIQVCFFIVEYNSDFSIIYGFM